MTDNTVTIRNTTRSRLFFFLDTDDAELIKLAGDPAKGRQTITVELGDKEQKPQENQAPAEQTIPVALWVAMVNERKPRGGWNVETRKADRKLKSTPQLTPQARALRGYVEDGTLVVRGPSLSIDGIAAA